LRKDQQNPNQRVADAAAVSRGPIETRLAIISKDSLMPSTQKAANQRVWSAFRRAFTLVELLVVVAVVGVLLGLTLPAVQHARESGRRIQCANNLRQIGMALQSYHAQYGRFPIGCLEPNGRRIAWSVALLPLLEHSQVHQQFHWHLAYNAPENLPATRTVISTYLCPSTRRYDGGRVGPFTDKRTRSGLPAVDSGMACIDYGGMYGFSDWQRGLSKPGMMVYDKPVSLKQATDGASETLLVAEDSGRGYKFNGEWANGQNIFDQSCPINRVQNNEMWSDHPGGVNGLFCDGAVRFLHESLDMAIVEAICTRDGEEIIDWTKLQ